MDFNTPTHLLLQRGLSHKDPFVRNDSIAMLRDNPRHTIRDGHEILSQLEAHGPERYEYLHLVCGFPLDDEGVNKLAAICRKWSSHGFREEVARLFQWFLDGPETYFPKAIALAKEIYKPIKGFSHLDPQKLIATMEYRMSLSQASSESLLKELEDEVESIGVPSDFPHSEWGVIELMCEAVGKYAELEEARKITKDWLELSIDPVEETGTEWKILTAVRLAGILQLTDSAEQLIDLLEHDWAFLNEEIERAFTQMNDENALGCIFKRWPSLPDYGKLFLSTPLEMLYPSRFRHFYLQAINDGETDSDCGFSLSIALMNLGDRDAIDTVIRHYWDYDLRDPEVLENASHLRTHLILRNYRTDLAAEIGVLLFEREKRKPTPTTLPFTPQTPFLPPNTGIKVGRNDPCPCGSGKKYKKCCLQPGLN